MEKIQKLKKLCHHFHLSLQSGSNETLKRMNRRYTKEEYLDIVEKMRISFPDVSITTDVIVGFPGETQEEFSETVDFLNELKLNKIHTFKYSPRKGTPAYLMKNQVEGSEKELRSNIVLGISEKLEYSYTSEIIGKIVEVLFEEGRDETYMGYTRNFIRVRVTSINHIKGQIRQVQIIGQDKETALGELLPLS
jgi:threonylcarbamoyladenosine tRNA methylthiotransferase MtaB